MVQSKTKKCGFGKPQIMDLGKGQMMDRHHLTLFNALPDLTTILGVDLRLLIAFKELNYKFQPSDDFLNIDCLENFGKNFLNRIYLIKQK